MTSVRRGLTYLGDHGDQHDESNPPDTVKFPYGLTVRELGVLYLLADGYTDREIADTLCITRFTVNCHVGAILGKMEVRSRTAAAVTAIREHIFAAGQACASMLCKAELYLTPTGELQPGCSCFE